MCVCVYIYICICIEFAQFRLSLHILGQKGPDNQVCLTTQERTPDAMVPPH